ncbi:MAG: cupin domain-containing protein [Planctomycetota bacterium]|jgi:quercetin dioxygenase-like cupin family protein
MPWLITRPATVTAAGTPPKSIDEYVGRLNSGHEELSVAIMRSPGGWSEPGQRPDFLEVSVVLRGTLTVEHEAGTLVAPAGSAVVCRPGEWVRYATPETNGAEYVAICLPAFSTGGVHRDVAVIPGR